MQGAWALLLRCHTSLDDLTFGTVVSGRPPQLEGVEGMVGLFINVLPVRVQVDDNATLTQWLQYLQSQQNERGQYEYSPLQQVQRWSGALAGTPLFESIVVFENFPRDADAPCRRGGRQRGGAAPSVEFRTDVPLLLSASPEGEVLQLQLTYDGGRFDGASMTRLLAALICAQSDGCQSATSSGGDFAAVT